MIFTSPQFPGNSSSPAHPYLPLQMSIPPRKSPQPMTIRNRVVCKAFLKRILFLLVFNKSFIKSLCSRLFFLCKLSIRHIWFWQVIIRKLAKTTSNSPHFSSVVFLYPFTAQAIHPQLQLKDRAIFNQAPFSLTLMKFLYFKKLFYKQLAVFSSPATDDSLILYTAVDGVSLAVLLSCGNSCCHFAKESQSSILFKP